MVMAERSCSHVDNLNNTNALHCSGTGVNGSFHDKDNNLLINKTLFPDMKAMNQKAHSMGLKTGWYLNNCVCNEKDTRPANLTLPKDAQMIADLEFDGVKVDGDVRCRCDSLWTF